MAGSSAVNAGSGVEVFVDALDDAPWCPHGPTLMFERFYQERESRRFFACSAHRKRSGCPFFQWADEKESAAKREVRMEIYQAARTPEVPHTTAYKSVETALQKPSSLTSVCTKCACSVTEKKSKSAHKGHTVLANLPPADLLCPTRLLPALDDSNSNAQYLFADKAVTCILGQLHSQGMRHVVCVGAPRIHEAIVSARFSKQEPFASMCSLLLDWDRRFASFFSPGEFQHFNMFNRHFFGGDSGLTSLAKFLGKAHMGQVAIVMDPPFGGLARPLAACVEWLWATAATHCKAVEGAVKSTSVLNSSSDATLQLATVWVFPYFLESQVLEAMPAMKMIDYKVDYDNHPLFTSVGRKKAVKRKSPVRLFTNINPSQMVLPAAEGYRLCEPCQRYVSAENQHCSTCQACTTKHGPHYVHCNTCKACVKPGRVHCNTCDQCLPEKHDCRRTDAEQDTAAASSPLCHRCGETGHKRRHCPEAEADTSGPKAKKAKRSKR